LQRLRIREPVWTRDAGAASVHFDKPFRPCLLTSASNACAIPAGRKIDIDLRSLLTWQDRPGSWPGAPNLRVTEQSCYEPWNDPIGIILHKDHFGLLTTATVIRVLTRIISARKAPQMSIAQ